MTLAEALALSATLETSESPRLDAELLLSAVLEQERSYLFTWPERVLTPAQIQAYQQLLCRRQAGEPIAYLLGKASFWTLDLEVSSATLIPRPDTETLVEWVLAHYDARPYRVADLGTGTGAIALALASERPSWSLCASDRIPEALALAQRNAERLQLTQQIEFCLGSWCQALTGKFDLILSNPPYIDAEDPHLQQGDVRFEPLSALVAPEQGLADIRELAEQAPEYLRPGGRLLLEHGWQQAAQVRTLLLALGYQEVFSAQDWAGRERISGGLYAG
ncbi:peptide chain release factor N(5)-glutamine methyltransferase [Nitrincola tapanii]|uniref:Release factor glutamine methyltransferase n=1 Tax=Nitrincola tapanii TaxID=1708751 RepID=A0A5A9W6Z0_9GAMM|nr:peptide chain release factor N(5)-glutamine methyltransferase [Nitrincola tapanii]KAA0876557.1 peptide chain release factor N(5)-glutamine methyltransferase [Nitrincola tapanii]